MSRYYHIILFHLGYWVENINISKTIKYERVPNYYYPNLEAIYVDTRVIKQKCDKVKGAR